MIPVGAVTPFVNPGGLQGMLAERDRAVMAYDAELARVEAMATRAAAEYSGTARALLHWYLVEVPSYVALHPGMPLVVAFPMRNTGLLRANGAPLYEAHVPRIISANCSAAADPAIAARVRAHNAALPPIPTDAFFAGIITHVRAPCDALQSMQWVCVQRRGLARVAKEYVAQLFTPEGPGSTRARAPRIGTLMMATMSGGTHASVGATLLLGTSLGTGPDAPYNLALQSEAGVFVHPSHARRLASAQPDDTIAVVHAPPLSLLTNTRAKRDGAAP